MSEDNKLYNPYAEAESYYDNEVYMDLENMSLEQAKLMKGEDPSYLVNLGAHFDEKLTGAASALLDRYKIREGYTRENALEMLEYSKSEEVSKYKDRGVSEQQFNYLLENTNSKEELKFALEDLVNRVIPAQETQAKGGMIENFVNGTIADSPTLIASALLTRKASTGIGTVGALPSAAKRTDSLADAIKLANRRARIKTTRMDKVGRSKKELAVEFGYTGVIDSMAVNLRNEFANYDDPDYIKDAAIEGAVGVLLGGLFGKSMGTTKTLNKSHRKDSSVNNVIDPEDVEAPTVSADEAFELSNEGFAHTVMFNDRDVTVGVSRKAIDNHIQRHTEESEVIKSDKAALDVEIKKQEEFLTERTKQVELELNADVRKAESKVIYKTDKGVASKQDELISGGYVKSTDVAALTDFVKKASGKIRKSTGIDVTPNKKVKETKGLIDEVKGDSKLFDAINKAQKLVDDANAKENIKQIKEANKETAKNVLAADRKRLNDLKKESKKLQKQLDKKQTILDKANSDKSHLDNMLDDDIVDTSTQIYDYFKSLSKLPNTLPANIVSKIRRVAEELEDSDVLESLKDIEESNGYKFGGMNTETIERIGEANKSNAGRSGSIFSFLHSTGAVLQGSNSKLARGIGDLMVNSNLANKDKSISTNTASSYVEQFLDNYKGRINNAIHQPQKRFFERHGIKFKFEGEATLMWNHVKSHEFNEYVYRAAQRMDNPKDKLDDLPAEAIEAAQNLRDIAIEYREQLAKSYPNMTAGELAALQESFGNSFMSRVRSNEFYKASRDSVDFDTHVKVHEGAILKATPWMNKTIELNKLKQPEVILESKAKRIKELEEEIQKIKDDFEAGLVDDAYVERIMKADGDSRYSSMVATNFYKNQLHRAENPKEQIAQREKMDNIVDTLKDAKIWDTLSDVEKRSLELYSNKEISKGATVDPFKSRIPMDMTYKVETVNKAGDKTEIEMFDYYDKHAQQVMSSTVRKYAGMHGLYKAGFKSTEDFEKVIADAKKEADSLSGLEKRNVLMALEKTENYFLTKPQYEREGMFWEFVDLAKNTMAATKLAFLPLAMSVELVNVVAYNGLGNTLRALGANKFADQLITGKIDMNDGMSAFYMAGGNTIDPLENFIMRTDAGVDQYGNATIIAKARDKMASYAAYTNYMSKSFDARIRAVNFQAQLNKLMTTDGKTLRSQYYKDHGMSDRLADHIEYIRDKYATIDKNGKVIDFDYKKYIANEEMAEEFMTTFKRLSDRSVQTNRFSDLPPWANTQAFGFLGQFKSFMLTAHSNQLLYHMSRPSTITATMFTGQMMMAYLTYVARVNYTYADDDAKREELLSPRVAAFAAFRGTGFGGLFSTIFGTGFGLATGTDPFAAGSTTGQQAYNVRSTEFFDSSTVARYTKDHLIALSAVGNIALGGSMSKSDLRTILGLYMPTTISSYATNQIADTFDIDKREANIVSEFLAR